MRSPLNGAHTGNGHFKALGRPVLQVLPSGQAGTVCKLVEESCISAAFENIHYLICMYVSFKQRAVGLHRGLVSGRGVVCRMAWGMDGGLVG